jgi:very-short-patch-repair endonuclease
MRRGTEVDRVIQAIAAPNNRVVTRRALDAAGIGTNAITNRVAVGHLHRIHHGVYLLDPPGTASRITLLTAAVEACGPTAVLSHRSAAELWKLLPAHPGHIEVTVVSRNAGDRPGIRRHRVPELMPPDIHHRHGVRVTAAARTVLDNARHRDLEELLATAMAGLVTPREIEEAIGRCPTRRGIARLQVILHQEGGPRRTRSWGERRTLSLVRQAGLPVPITNTLLHGHQVDALWPTEKLVVETDGWDFHRDRAAFENDRARDATHVANGYRVLRFTGRQLRDQPLTVIARLASALAITPPSGP